MNQLYLLQFVCCVITAMFALMLVVSRFQMRWLNKRYETSRWLLCFSMFMLAFHYVLQMEYNIRAKSDEMGGLVNILFYSPISLVISYATYHVVCMNPLRRKRYVYIASADYFCILATLMIGFLVNGNLHLGAFLKVMLGFFMVGILYSFAVNIIEMRRHRKMMEEDSGADLLPYDRYTWASYIMMGVSVMMLAGAMFYRPLLFICGPLMLLSLFVFTQSFIAYGFNIMPSDVVLDEMTESEEEKVNESELQERVQTKVIEDYSLVEKALKKWCAEGGFRDSTVNMMTLALKLEIPKEQLSRFFDQYPAGNFRTWLSDVRFKEAQRILIEHPYFNNDTISAECGFSSHAHLYKIFKAKTGMTPGQWRKSLNDQKLTDETD